MSPSTATTVIIAMLVITSTGTAGADPGSSTRATNTVESPGREQAVHEATEVHLPGNRLVEGRVKDIRGEQMEVDIGNLQPLYVPLRAADIQGPSPKVGDPLIVTLNDHNAVVGFQRPGEHSRHRAIKGRLTTPLTVGLDKAVLETDAGTQSFPIADRAKAKLGAMPVGPEIWIMADDSGVLVDAQLASPEAVRESGQGNKARIKGAHRQLRGTFQGLVDESSLKLTEGEKKHVLPYRPPLPKLDRIEAGQHIGLLLDDEGYVLEITTPDVPPTR